MPKTCGSGLGTERHEAGVLDTCTYIDLGLPDPAALPKIPGLTAITVVTTPV